MAERRAPGATRAHGQHFLRSPRLAAAIVDEAGVGPGDLVLEIGAGDGRLTRPLAASGASVLAVELDPRWARSLRTQFRSQAAVSVIEADALRVPLPAEPFRTVANVPFHLTTAVLRRLVDDPGTPLIRADLIVEWAVGAKRARCWPSTMLGVVWGARYEFAVLRRLPAACFAPRPAVDAAVLRVTHRERPLVPQREHERFRAFVEAGFRGGGRTLRRALAPWLPQRRFKELARELGLDPSAAARDLDLRQWVAVFGAVRRVR